MLTKNFHSCVAAKFYRKNIRNGLVAVDGTVCDVGYHQSAHNYEKLFDYIYFLYPNAGYGVRIGKGTTPATPNDHNLESMITSGFSTSNQSNASLSVDENGVSMFATYAITNTSAEPLVISEIGMFAEVMKTNTNATITVMLERTVLETPITISPGEAKSLTYTIRMNYPTA